MKPVRRPPAKRYPPRMLEVREVLGEASAKTRKIRFIPSSMEGLGPHCAGAHIKLFFPREHQQEPVLPTLGPKGPIWPPPDQKPIVRTYSICEINLEAGWMGVEFVLHSEYGPASDWALKAVPGQKVGMAGPGPSMPVLAIQERPLLMFGDLSARPAMQAILGALDPAVGGQGVVFVPDLEQRIAFPTPQDFELRWSMRNPWDQPSFVGSGELEAMVAPYDEGPAPYLWAAGEHHSVVEIRDHLRARWNLPPNDFYAVPYWRYQQNEEQYHDQRHRVVDDLKS